MSSLEDRIKKARNIAGLTQPQLAKILDVSHRTITNHEKDASKITVQIAQKIASVCKVNEVWLLTGKGNMVGSEPTEDLQHTTRRHQDLVREFRDPIRGLVINQRLIELEKINQAVFDRVDAYIAGAHESARIMKGQPAQQPGNHKAESKPETRAEGEAKKETNDPR
ncbi:MAG: helix-turn-helix domain-containing protein [Desulfotignum sp.]|nr:helix-turn-helix domain-containing protein [Desulfotignum sp.]